MAFIHPSLLPLLMMTESVGSHHGPLEAPGDRSEALPLCHARERGHEGSGGDQDRHEAPVCQEGESHV